jgi:HK97 gp10 family phage protein
VGIVVRHLKHELPHIQAELRSKASAVVRKTAFDIEADAKGRAPVDTGALRASIATQVESDLRASVNVGVSYGAYVEYGTVRAPAQPYLTPAANAALLSFVQALKGIFA